MRAMILAAGRGERMGEMTREIPKPLIKIAGKYLIEYSLESLIKIGIKEIVINISYRGAQIKQALGNGERYGVRIHYSEEPEALETGGGIFQALPLLGDEPFLVLSCDVITDFPLQNLPKQINELAHIVLVDNPTYYARGDFCLLGHRVYLGVDNTFTFGNIGIYHPELFAGCTPGRFRLGEILKREIANQKISGEHYQGLWYNVGTPEQADLAQKQFSL